MLRGNLAPQGAVIKTAGVKPQMLKFSGRAVIFESEIDAYLGIVNGRIKAGDLVLLEAMGGGFTWGAILLRW